LPDAHAARLILTEIDVESNAKIVFSKSTKGTFSFVNRGRTCLHYAEPQGRKDCEAGLTENGPLRLSREQRLLADYAETEQ